MQQSRSALGQAGAFNSTTQSVGIVQHLVEFNVISILNHEFGLETHCGCVINTAPPCSSAVHVSFGFPESRISQNALPQKPCDCETLQAQRRLFFEFGARLTCRGATFPFEISKTWLLKLRMLRQSLARL